MPRLDDFREIAHTRSTGVASALVPDKILYPRGPNQLPPLWAFPVAQLAYSASNIQIYMFMILLITTGLGTITVGHVFRRGG